MRVRAALLLFSIFAHPVSADIIGGVQNITFNGETNPSSSAFAVPGGVNGITFLQAGGAELAFNFSAGLTSRLVLTIDLFNFGFGNQALANPVDWNFNALTVDGDSRGILGLTFLPGASTPGVTDPTTTSSFTSNSITIQTASGDNPGPEILEYAFDVATVPEPSHFFALFLATAFVAVLRSRSLVKAVS